MQSTTSVGSGCSSSVRHSWSRLPAAGSGSGDIEEAIKRIARFECPVLITGETGVGKDEVARAIHGAGPRRDRPFVTVNCGGLVNSLAESQLFGHEKGAFTGATSASAGAFRTADGGTVFLDEIGEMPIDLQPRLLHVLQHQVVVPVGASREHPVNVHVIAATNRNLPAEIRRGAFREDLFHRLNTFELAIPPLRKRTPEIPAFIAHFSAHFAAKYHLPLWRPSAELLARFLRHSWPGNVRQIAQTIQRVYVFHDSIDEVLREVFDTEPSRAQPPAGAAVGPPEAAGLEPGPLDFNLEELRRRTVRRAMAHTGGRRAITAQLLGVSPNTLTKLVAEACPAIPPRTKPRSSRMPPRAAAAGRRGREEARSASPQGDYSQLPLMPEVEVYQVAPAPHQRFNFLDPHRQGNGIPRGQ
jgi:DNA-binding NtrC family response regulator